MTKYLVICLLLYSITCSAQISLPKLISDGAVLQRDQPLDLWGNASPGEEILISLGDETYKTHADQNGHWEASLPSHHAGGPHTITFKGKNEILLNDIIFGDVWLATGQSNMVLNMERVKEKYSEEIAKANYPDIRNFFVKTMTELNHPKKDFPEGEWVVATPENVLSFGALTYFFARELYDTYQVPIGIINASVGGTPIQAWVSKEGLKEFPDLKEIIKKNTDSAYVNERWEENRKNRINRPENDMGMLSEPKWFEENYQPKEWQRINIPGFWEDQGLKDLDGIVWYRKEIEVPEELTGVEAKLYMGRIVDSDHLYINGELVGNITYQYPPRRYIVPSGLLKPGRNTIIIRVRNDRNKGGFVPDKPYYLIANGQEVDLKGYWHYKVGQVFDSAEQIRNFFSAQNQPTALYNAMTSPVVAQCKIKGILWYQGESNTGYPAPYGDYLKALIKDYRRHWGNPTLPFLYVQLANFMERDFHPVESKWAELRHGQLEALDLPNTAMTVTIDLGEWNDIHPLNKKDIGLRLALGAKALAYGDKEVVYSGPIYRSHQVAGNKMIISFDHIGDGLKSINGEPLRQFTIAGPDKKFVWAKANITGDKVEVYSDDIIHPKYVRYAWSNNPFGANLSNDSGLPASPFQADENPESELWRGKKAAVVLTYDDALEVHLDNVIPLLDEFGFKGSFYLSASFPGCENRLDDWKKAAENGHELGNHTLYHPCDASKPGRSWVSPENDLSQYSTAQISREIEMTNIFLTSLDGKSERTFAFTCGDTGTSEGSFVEAIEDEFIAMRGTRGKLNRIESLNLNNMDCMVVDENNEEQLITWAESAREKNALLVVLFHGVGGGHNINVSLNKHHEFIQYLKDHEEEFWVTTLLDAANHIIQYKKQ